MLRQMRDLSRSQRRLRRRIRRLRQRRRVQEKSTSRRQVEYARNLFYGIGTAGQKCAETYTKLQDNARNAKRQQLLTYLEMMKGIARQMARNYTTPTP
jgi:hypothetical protein